MLVSGIKGSGMTLLFGCRQSDMDHLYREETQEMKRKGVLKEVYTAYSRQPGQAKVSFIPLPSRKGDTDPLLPQAKA